MATSPPIARLGSRRERTLAGHPTRLDIAVNLAISYLGIARSLRLTDIGKLPSFVTYLRVWPGYTMLGWTPFRETMRLVSDLRKNGPPGAIVECGTWRGGCAAGMASVVRSDKSRHVWLFDSFEGMPEATEADRGTEAAELLAGGHYGGNLSPVGHLAADIREVRELLFDRLGLDKDRVHLYKGWFQETLAKTKGEIGPIAFLRVDGDWYESTRVVMEELFPQVVSGGYVMIDDYGAFPGCRRAVDEYRKAHRIETPITWTDDTVVWFVKP